MLLRRKVSLHDIEDVEAFVIMCIKRSGIKIDPRDYDEMKCEALLLLYAMEKNFIPRMEGYTTDGRFSGYAIKYMPRKVAEVWHRKQEHFVHRTCEDGKRRWIELLPPESYDKMIEIGIDDPVGGLDETRLRRIHEFLPQEGQGGGLPQAGD